MKDTAVKWSSGDEPEKPPKKTGTKRSVTKTMSALKKTKEVPPTDSLFRDPEITDPLKYYRATDDPDQHKLLKRLQKILVEGKSQHRLYETLPVTREIERVTRLQKAHQAQADLLKTLLEKAQKSKLYKRLIAEEKSK